MRTRDEDARCGGGWEREAQVAITMDDEARTLGVRFPGLQAEVDDEVQYSVMEPGKRRAARRGPITVDHALRTARGPAGAGARQQDEQGHALAGLSARAGPAFVPSSPGSAQREEADSLVRMYRSDAIFFADQWVYRGDNVMGFPPHSTDAAITAWLGRVPSCIAASDAQSAVCHGPGGALDSTATSPAPSRQVDQAAHPPPPAASAVTEAHVTAVPTAHGDVAYEARVLELVQDRIDLAALVIYKTEIAADQAAETVELMECGRRTTAARRLPHRPPSTLPT